MPLRRGNVRDSRGAAALSAAHHRGIDTATQPPTEEQIRDIPPKGNRERLWVVKPSVHGLYHPSWGKRYDHAKPDVLSDRRLGGPSPSCHPPSCHPPSCARTRPEGRQASGHGFTELGATELGVADPGWAVSQDAQVGIVQLDAVHATGAWGDTMLPARVQPAEFPSGNRPQRQQIRW